MNKKQNKPNKIDNILTFENETTIFEIHQINNHFNLCETNKKNKFGKCLLKNTKKDIDDYLKSKKAVYKPQHIKTITKKEEINSLINDKKLLIIDTYTEWCEPCKDFLPVLDMFCKMNKNNITCGKLDSDLNNFTKNFTGKNKINVYPNLSFWRKNKTRNQKILEINGTITMKELENILKNMKMSEK